jgi:cell wall-associated NlpC family hydrolase
VRLTDKCMADFKAEVLARYPEEACGFVVADEFVPCKNIAEDPLKHFKVANKTYLKHARTGKLQAVLHSHPYSLTERFKWPKEWPSSDDMRAQIAMNIPWGIVATEGEGLTRMIWLGDVPPPLEGREFIHGVLDCYSICRDYYREQGIVLPDYPRDMEWWDHGEDLYSQNFAAAGFVEITAAEATTGDAVLMGVGTSVVNHAAVIVGPNRILHQLFNRMSGVEPLNKWDRKVAKYLRYKG